jgi:hypothetical protein
MKKILLSVIALFAAVSMNAQTAVNDDPSYFNLDKSSGWGGKWFDLGPDGNLDFDASAYEYAWIKFSGNTGKFRFGLTYSEWKSTEAWGETYFDAMNVITDAEGISFIKLEKEKTYEFDVNKADNPYKGDTWDKHIRQIWTQDDGEEVSVTVEGIWFGTAAELKAALGGGSSEGGSEGGEEGGEAPAAGDWGAVIFNGDCEGEDAGCLLSKDGNDIDNFKWNVKEGAGVDGSKCATVYATGAAANEWDAQFFIYAKDYVFKAGDKFKFSMMIKADKEAESSAQAHVAPGTYLHWTIIGGPVKFTTEWAEYKFEGEVPAEADGMQTIAFNLNQDKTLENNYYFDNISWEVEGAPTAIQKVQVVKAENGARYNLAGQKVDAAYKGIVIQNGKKFIQK